MPIFNRLAVVGVAGAVLIACSGDERPSFPSRVPVESPASSKTRVVGLVGTMSGADSWRGEDAFEGADVAVQQLNRSLRRNEPKFELVTLDDRGDADAAAAHISQLAGSDRTVGIVYAGPTEALPEAEAVLAEARIPALLTYGDLYTRRLLSPHVFQVSPAYLWQARAIARYLVRDRRYRRIGSITSEGLDGEAARTALGTAFAELGVRHGPSFAYRAQSGLPAAIRAMRDRKIQAVVLEGTPGQIESILAFIRRSDASYRTTPIARRAARRAWRPQIAAFDLGISRTIDPAVLQPGTVAADTYARGAHYLPVPSFVEFRRAFSDWWSGAVEDPLPFGWERRAYEAVHMIGWAARRTRSGRSVARVLEKMTRKREGGLDITFGPDDHTSVDQTTVGLWVVPGPNDDVREDEIADGPLPWVPLARGFAIDGERTDIPARDWRYLFTGSPKKNRPAPRIGRQRFGIATKRADPLH